MRNSQRTLLEEPPQSLAEFHPSQNQYAALFIYIFDTCIWSEEGTPPM